MRNQKKKRLLLSLWMLLVTGGSVCGAARAAIKTKINPRDGATMVYVPAGTFTMGGADKVNAWAGCEQPAHKVTLKGYWIYKTEVTVAQYRKFCKATRRIMPRAPQWGWINSHPMVNMNWNDALTYCAWARTKLPTEAQWEKAARGTDGRIYPWGNKFDKSKCWTAENHATQTKPVGSFPSGASPYGCLDMAGNVWELCLGWIVDHPHWLWAIGFHAGTTPDTHHGYTLIANSQNSPEDKFHAVRGGSWTYGADDCHTTSRNGTSQTDRNSFTGFRCVVPDHN